ncbi:MAG: gamma-glutamyl-gamma-aminobutyrate hydrolase family protein [Candidatus Omnitrophica bacterium]|nr:gamma-glutamyl-gamma-aminobutyrate hydrolase family protein [Candidatus Omnitrophota bacterium]
MVAVSQRVVVKKNERRDALDSNWAAFLERCGFLPLEIPNRPSMVERLLKKVNSSAVLLTGGNDLAVYGGDSPERDATETLLLEYALRRGLPLLGVCRGMQLIQNYYGVKLKRVKGHVVRSQSIRVRGRRQTVNSYHCWGALETREPLEVWAVADDGVIKAIRHRHKPVLGIMWHPERFAPFRGNDIRGITDFLRGIKRQL